MKTENRTAEENRVTSQEEFESVYSVEYAILKNHFNPHWIDAHRICRAMREHNSASLKSTDLLYTQNKSQQSTIKELVSALEIMIGFSNTWGKEWFNKQDWEKITQVKSTLSKVKL